MVNKQKETRKSKPNYNHVSITYDKDSLCIKVVNKKHQNDNPLFMSRYMAVYHILI